MTFNGDTRSFCFEGEESVRRDHALSSSNLPGWFLFPWVQAGL